MKFTRVGYLPTAARQNLKDKVQTTLCTNIPDDFCVCPGCRRVRVTVTVEELPRRKR